MAGKEFLPAPRTTPILKGASVQGPAKLVLHQPSAALVAAPRAAPRATAPRATTPPARRLTLLLVSALCATIGLGGGGLAYTRLAPPPDVGAAPAHRPTLQTVTAELKPITVTIAASGTVMASRQSQLAFRNPGRVDKVLVAPGDAVTEGQALVTLDLKEFQLGQAQAQATLDLAKTRLEAARVGTKPEDVRAIRQALDALSARLRQLPRGPGSEDAVSFQQTVDAAAKTLAPLEAGTQLGDVTAAQTALDDARAKLGALPGATPVPPSAGAPSAAPATADTASSTAPATAVPAATPTASPSFSADDGQRAQSTLDRMKALLAQLRDVAVAQAQVTVAQTQLDQVKLGLDDATLTAPFAGIVGAVTTGPGEVVGANTPVLTVLDPRTMRADVVVGEGDVARIKRAQAATLTFDAAPGRTVDGQVTLILPLPSKQASVASYAVQLTMQAPADLLLFPGMAVQAAIVTDSADAALLIPTRAIRVTPKGEREVDVQADDGTIFPRTIKTGLTTNTMTQVVDGLYPSDKVVLPLLP